MIFMARNQNRRDTLWVRIERKMLGESSMLLEEKARVKIDKQLINAGWDIVSRDEYVPKSASAVKEALMQGNTESD